ncbi:MAG: hypothetical protein ACRDJN_19650 [Chloroflexota bacterium]
MTALTLARLLADYDRANRLAIDAVYAQFSPTLDDFYAEELRLEIGDTVDAGGELPVEIALTRTVPGTESKTVRGDGVPFPLARAGAVFSSALADAPAERGNRLQQRYDRGLVWLRPRQAGRTQGVALALEPDGQEVLALLAELAH